MLLSIKNVSKKYNNGTEALKNVSFDVEKGEFISIIGPSGSGKSTLLRSINKMTDISEGSILFENQNIEKLKKKEINLVRREIGMIFQNYNLVERLTVIENVLHGRLGYKSEFIRKKKKKRHLLFWKKSIWLNMPTRNVVNCQADRNSGLELQGRLCRNQNCFCVMSRLLHLIQKLLEI